MLTFHTEKHRLRDSKGELSGGEFIRPHERPERAEIIISRIREIQLGPVQDPDDFGPDPLLRVHAPEYLEFLQTVWDQWKAAGFSGEVVAANWPARGMRQKMPQEIEGKVGYFALAAETAICPGTWRAAQAAANCALSAARAVRNGESAAFALCRPPGHHAAADLYGGYCFLNNAALAAQWLLDNGAKKIAVLDIDFHHGNGTQDIFYRRGDVFFASLHGDPAVAFPHFLGFADETGEGDGQGCNANFPMPPATPFSEWRKALGAALEKIAKFAPETLVVSLGVDAFCRDPISFFKLESPDFHAAGAAIAGLNLPAVFVMEGGYAVAEIGVNTANVLQGFAEMRGGEKRR